MSIEVWPHNNEKSSRYTNKAEMGYLFTIASHDAITIICVAIFQSTKDKYSRDSITDLLLLTYYPLEKLGNFRPGR